MDLSEKGRICFSIGSNKSQNKSITPTMPEQSAGTDPLGNAPKGYEV